jgi:ABC-type transporter Mla subunit MlaD
VNGRKLRIRLGLFVLAALVLLAALVVLFGSLPAWFTPSTLYTVRFSDAPGVAPGTPVRRAGVRIGAVRSVALDDERGIVRVQIAIDPRFTVRRNEQATLISGLLGSDASIDFVAQPPEEGRPVDRGPVEPGAELVGVHQATVNTLLNRASEVVPTTQETMNEMRKSLQRVERMAPLAEDTMREFRDLARAAREALPDLRRTNDEVLELAKSSRQALPDLRRSVEDVAAAARIWTRVGERTDLLLQTNAERINRIIDNLNEAVGRALGFLSEENQKNVNVILKNTRGASERLDDISRNLDEGMKDARKAANRLNETLNRADATLADAQKLMRSMGETLTRVDVVLVDTQKITRLLADRGEGLVRATEQLIADLLHITAPLVPRAEAIARNLDATLADMHRVAAPLADRSERITHDLESSLARLNAILGDVGALLRVIDQCDSTLRRFLTDPSLYLHLDEAVTTVVRLVPRVDRILKDMETFADKLARHPESLGLGGVVHPSTGLKDPPTPPRPP